MRPAKTTARGGEKMKALKLGPCARPPLAPVPPRASPQPAPEPQPAPQSATADHPDIPTATRADGLEYLRIEDIRHRLTRRPSPFTRDNNAGGGFVGDLDLLQIDIVQYETEESSGAQCQGVLDPSDGSCIVLPQFAVRSGPREHIYHDPRDVTAAIVTCGGLCPGLNDVVLNIVTTLADYGVPDDQILGIRYGLRGFLDRHAKPVQLSKREVDGIQLRGGTVLGTSRGNAKITKIVEVRFFYHRHLTVITPSSHRHHTVITSYTTIAANPPMGRDAAVRHRRQRRQRRRARHRKAVYGAGCRMQRRWRAQVDRQRYSDHRQVLRL